MGEFSGVNSCFPHNCGISNGVQGGAFLLSKALLDNSTPEHREGPSEAVAVPGFWKVS